MRTETGAGVPLFIGKLAGESGSGKKIDLYYFSSKIGKDVYSIGDFTFNLYAGGALFVPLSREKSNVYSFIIEPGVYYTGWYFYPYLSADLGLSLMDKPSWKYQSTYMNFIVNGNLGVKFPVSEKFSWYLGYKFFHLSNARVELPNKGYNTDILLTGIEFDF